MYLLVYPTKGLFLCVSFWSMSMFYIRNIVFEGNLISCFRMNRFTEGKICFRIADSKPHHHYYITLHMSRRLWKLTVKPKVLRRGA